MPTDITVTVMDADGDHAPARHQRLGRGPGLHDHARWSTDAAGVAVITVTTRYGPTLDIVGQDPAETYRLFTEPVTVNALRPDGVPT